MSTHGSRKTSLFALDVDYIIGYESDYSTRFDPHIEVFGRLWKWELTASLRRGAKAWVRGYRFLAVPRLGTIDWNVESFDAHQYNGDYTEWIEEDRKARR